MIVSCHVPKTAGTSFGELLKKQYGERLCLDYGDRVGWETPEAAAWRASRPISDMVLGRQVDCVHGHFYVSKYLGLDHDIRIVTFVREPVERVISNFRFLQSHPEIQHPLVSLFHDARPSLRDWASWSWARNLQSRILDGVALEGMALVGITERYRESIERFDARFGTALCDLDDGTFANRSDDEVEVSPEEREVIMRLNLQDVQLYQRALALFEMESGR